MVGNNGFFGFCQKDSKELVFDNLAQTKYGVSGATISNWSGSWASVVDNNDATYWACASNPVADDWIILKLKNPYGVRSIRFYQYPYNGQWGSTQFRVQTSKDLNTWVTVKTIYPLANNIWIHFDAEIYEKYWRFYAVTGGSNSWNIYTIELWGYYYN